MKSEPRHQPSLLASRSICSVIKLLLAMVAGTGPALAQTYYVRADAAGRADGSDWTNAFTALPASMVRGATYLIADGTYAGRRFDTAVSGTSKITIRKATETSHGTDAGWASTYGDGVALFTGGLEFATSFWEVDGVTGADRTGHGIEIFTQGNTVGIHMPTAVTDLTFRSLNVHAYPETTDVATLRISKYQHAVRILGGGNFTFSNCYIHHIFGCCFLIRQCNGLVIERCYLSNNANTAAMHSEAISDDGSDNVVLRNNKWCDIEGTAFIAGLNGPLGSAAENWTVVGNVFWHTETFAGGVSEVISVLEDSSNNVHASNWLVANNTIATIKGRFSLSFGSSKTTNVRVLNNLFWQNRPNNLYQNYGFITIGGTGSARNFNYYALCAFPWSFGNAANENPIYGGPNCKLSDAPGFPGFLNPAGGDFRLKGPISGYPGTPVTEEQAFADGAGNRRGGDGIWDIGAFEVASAPSNARIQIRTNP